ncbi:tastin [Anas acuta]|uniref:tastin n=1 Tax=Anas acuta TaxID=28680 RepID=UPI0035C8AE9B
MASRGLPGGGESRAAEPRGTPPFQADPAALAAILRGPGAGPGAVPGARPKAGPGGAGRASLAGRVPLRLGSLRTQGSAPGAAARSRRRSAPRSPQASRPLQRLLDRASGFSLRVPGAPPLPRALPAAAAAPGLGPRGEAPKEAAGARSRSLKKHTDQQPPAAVKAETPPAVLAPVLPSEQLSEVGGATGGKPCLARRVPARIPLARGTTGAARGAQGPPQTVGGAQAAPPGSLVTQESTSLFPDLPSNESSTPGAEPLKASGPSNVGLARRVPLTKAMRLEVSKERFFRTPRLTPRSCVSGTHQRPLKWRLALTPQRGPSTDAADSKEEAPPWENIVVQLFREDEGQQDPEGPVQALPSASPGSSTAQDKAVVQLFGGDKGQQDPKVMANAALALPKAQRVPLLLQLLWQDLQDLPGVIEVLRNLWGCVAQHGLVPLSPHQGPCKHPGQL